jgi:hypothetical protein
VYYTCLGLGFTGWYTGQPEYLRKKQLEISARIRSIMDVDEAARICPEAYENVDTSDLVQPPGMKLMGIALALVGMIIVVFVANFLLYRSTASGLQDSLRTIIDRRESTPVPAKPVPAAPAADSDEE